MLQLPVIIFARLRDINQGEWEGQFVEIIMTNYSELWRQRSVDPASVRPPGGETVGEVAARAYSALDDIARNVGTNSALIVSHGLTIATIICKARGIPIGNAYQVIPDNVELIWVDWTV